MALTMMPVNLFIFNFRKDLLMKKRVKYVIASLVFCVLLVFCGKFFRYILVDDTSSYTRITFHEMYEQDNIDVLFAGSSPCYRAFVPEILDDELGMNTYNAGTSAQNLDGSYMVIREAAKYNDIKHIYLDIYYNLAFEIYKDRTEMTQTYIISDYLRPSLDKIGYLLNASTKEYYFNSFILARRNWSKFFDADYIQNLLMKKQTDAYKNYEYTYVTGDTEWYAGKGYVANKERVENWNYFSDNSGNNVDFNTDSKDWLDSLSDIIAFCDKKDISLTLVSVPMSNFLLADLENYDDYVNLVKKSIAGTGVEYYDFNLCKEEYFPNISSLFKDKDHLNNLGAEKFSRLLASFVKGQVSESTLFYNSFNEKIQILEPTVFGISYCDNKKENGEIQRDCKIVSTCNSSLEYEIILIPDGRKEYKIQDFSDNRFFTVPPGEHGICVISYRLNSEPEQVETVEISY